MTIIPCFSFHQIHHYLDQLNRWINTPPSDVDERIRRMANPIWMNYQENPLDLEHVIEQSASQCNRLQFQIQAIRNQKIDLHAIALKIAQSNFEQVKGKYHTIQNQFSEINKQFEAHDAAYQVCNQYIPCVELVDQINSLFLSLHEAFFALDFDQIKEALAEREQRITSQINILNDYGIWIQEDLALSEREINLLDFTSLEIINCPLSDKLLTDAVIWEIQPEKFVYVNSFALGLKREKGNYEIDPAFPPIRQEICLLFYAQQTQSNFEALFARVQQQGWSSFVNEELLPYLSDRDISVASLAEGIQQQRTLSNRNWEEYLLDPIFSERFENPVSLKCGHSYSQNTLKQQTRCPICRTPMQKQMPARILEIFTQKIDPLKLSQEELIRHRTGWHQRKTSLLQDLAAFEQAKEQISQEVHQNDYFQKVLVQIENLAFQLGTTFNEAMGEIEINLRLPANKLVEQVKGKLPLLARNLQKKRKFLKLMKLEQAHTQDLISKLELEVQIHSKLEDEAAYLLSRYQNQDPAIVNQFEPLIKKEASYRSQLVRSLNREIEPLLNSMEKHHHALLNRKQFLLDKSFKAYDPTSQVSNNQLFDKVERIGQAAINAGLQIHDNAINRIFAVEPPSSQPLLSHIFKIFKSNLC